jgi:hypothetical protein
MTARVVFLAAATLLACVVSAQTETKQKTIVKRTFVEGASKVYSVRCDLTINDGGAAVEVTEEMTRKCTSIVKDTGAKMLVEHGTPKILVDGQEMSLGDRQLPTVKFLVYNDGHCGKLVADSEGPEAAISRLFVFASCIPLPADGVSPGDKWKGADAKEADPSIQGTSDYEFVGPEDITGTAKALKVKVRFKGTSEGSPTPIEINGNVWLDPTSGEMVRLVSQVTNLQVAGRAFSGTLTIQPKEEKKSGSPRND